MSDLYILQNEYGLIKIGRSMDVDRRRRALVSTEVCEIATVAIIIGAGHLEEEMHIQLDAYRIIGEWFQGTKKAKAAILENLPLNSQVEWPYKLAKRSKSNVG